MRITWGALGRQFGLKGSNEALELPDDAPILGKVFDPGLESVTSAGANTSSQPDPESERLRSELAAARVREEQRIRRDGQSFAALVVRDEKAPPYLTDVLAAEYEAMALADLDRPLAEGVRIRVGETECSTRVEAVREHFAQLKPAGHTTQRALDRARTVENGSAGEPDVLTKAREQGRAAALAFNGRK
jgi:hypothetical protein